MSGKRKHREAFSEHVPIYGNAPRSSNFEKVERSQDLVQILNKNSNKLTVLMGTCKDVHAASHMWDIVNQFALRCPQVHFLEVEIGEKVRIPHTQHIEKIPTFIFYKNNESIDKIEGAFPERLKAALFKLAELSPWDDEGPKGTVDLIHYVNLKECEALNTAEETPFHKFLANQSNLISDCDDQLIMAYGFNQHVKVDSIKIKGPLDTGPRSLKIFINQVKSLDFDDAVSGSCTQLVRVRKGELSGESFLKLDQVRFQKVKNMYIFIEGNQCGGDVTELEVLKMYGQPVWKEKGLTGQSSSLVTL